MTSETRDELIAAWKEARGAAGGHASGWDIADELSEYRGLYGVLENIMPTLAADHPAHAVFKTYRDPAAFEAALFALIPSPDAIIEECAKVADRQAESHAHNAGVLYEDAATPEKHRFAATVSAWIATSIRRLKSPAPPSGDAT